MKSFFSTRQTTRVSRGFTFVELIIGVSLFLIVMVSMYDAYTTIFHIVVSSRAKVDAVDLANEQLEIARNLPYSDVGISGGIPNGKLSHVQTITRDSFQFVLTTTIRNIDDPFDGTLGGTPNDTSPSDYKLVEVQVDCATCLNFTPLILDSRIAPKNLETASTNGALIIRAFDANGNAVSGANVHIENKTVSPKITIDDVTDTSGTLEVVDAPPGTNAYEITVNKTGYSTDKTMAASSTNPTPTNPFATVLLQQITQTSFFIDRVSTIVFSSVDGMCSPVGGMDFDLSGGKLIGTPAVLKYSKHQTTDGSGNLTLSNMEWDTYTVLANDSAYDLLGINPLSPFTLAPNSTQNVQLVVGTKTPDTILITVKDGATGLPLSDVSVELSKSGFDQTKVTGQGFVHQTDWSGGSGQATSTNATKYLSSDGNIETVSPAGDMNLKKVFGSYVSSGQLISSTFDNGSSGNNWSEVYWTPVGQPAAVGTPNVRMQIATNNNGGTWNYLGPDGTSGTYYTTASQDINAINNGNRYLRYKLFLDTASSTATPTVSDISFTYTSSCTPPGQVAFTGLSAGTYTMTLSKDGYADQTVSVSVNSNWQAVSVNMAQN